MGVFRSGPKRGRCLKLKDRPGPDVTAGFFRVPASGRRFFDNSRGVRPCRRMPRLVVPRWRTSAGVPSARREGGTVCRPAAASREYRSGDRGLRARGRADCADDNSPYIAQYRASRGLGDSWRRWPEMARIAVFAGWGSAPGPPDGRRRFHFGPVYRVHD